MSTSQERTWLDYPSEPGRRIGVRVERRIDAEGPSPVIVLCHGFKGFMDWGFFPLLSSRMAEAGFVAVSLNASGCGVGDNPLEMDDESAFFQDTYTRQLEDISRVREFARELPGVDPAREALLGHSRGGGMCVLSAAKSPPTALVTWSAIDDADRFDDAAKARWRADGELCIPNGRTGQIHRLSTAALDDLEQHREQLDILAAAARYPGPFLAIHGRDDATVPWEAAERLANRAQKGSSFIVEAANHSFGATHPMTGAIPRPLEAAMSATDAHLQVLLRSD